MSLELQAMGCASQNAAALSFVNVLRAITSAKRFLVEIEIKRSLSDFKADGKKPHRQDSWRAMFADHQPRWFYYFVPIALKEAVLPLLPEWAGLIVSHHHYLQEVEKIAPQNELSRRLTFQECIRIVELQSNHLLAA